jgi:O-antigen ligase
MMLPLQLFQHTQLAYHQPICVAEWRNSEFLLKKISQNPFIRFALILQVALGLVILILTQSFGGWLCLLVSVSFLSGYWIKKKKISLRAVFPPLIIIAVAIGAWIYWVSKRRGFGLLNFSIYENPISLRCLNFKVALSIFRDFPWSGVGLENYGTINPVYQQSVVNVTQYTHNTFLQLLSECGIPFLVFTLFFAILTVRDWLLWASKQSIPNNLVCCKSVCLFHFRLGWLII